MKTERIELINGDITTVDADAIVNAANHTLRGGGGVDGAIHRAAGPDLLTECEKLKGCETGEAKITSGYQLKAKHIIHTVGPVWRGGHLGENELLASCYQKSLILAKNHKIKTIAFPCISTGAFGFPPELAAFIAVTETRRFLKNNKLPVKILFVTFGTDHYELYRKLLNDE
jgi:O-acetyl-ADP-ribose deacetylase